MSPRNASVNPVRLLIAPTEVAAPLAVALAAGAAVPGINAAPEVEPPVGIAPAAMDEETADAETDAAEADEETAEGLLTVADGPPCGPYTKFAQAILVLFA